MCGSRETPIASWRMHMNELVKSPKALVVGTGLVALDVIRGVSDTDRHATAAGGTCANVLASLSMLGWKSVPVARLGDDAAGQLVRDDLMASGVDVELLGLEPRKPTPIVVQLNEFGKGGELTHRFVWRCPTCGGHLPRYSPVTLPAVERTLRSYPAPDVFFFDRPSPAALKLAREYAKRDVLVVFEPSAGANSAHFAASVAVADVVKYSAERFSVLEMPPASGRRALLEVQTLGRRGLRYRDLRGARSRKWRRMAAFETVEIVDTAGCGDWTTAGIVDAFGAGGRARLLALDATALSDAITRGQAFAAWSAGFLGARGASHAQTARQCEVAVSQILREGSLPTQIHGGERERQRRTSSVCSKCPGAAA